MKRLAAEDFDEQWDPFHTCVGHNPEDLQPFHNLFPSWDSFNATLSDDIPSPAEGAATSGKPAGLKQYYKNKELYDLLRPDTEHLPYMYDNFQWPHCSVSLLWRVLAFLLLEFLLLDDVLACWLVGVLDCFFAGLLAFCSRPLPPFFLCIPSCFCLSSFSLLPYSLARLLPSRFFLSFLLFSFAPLPSLAWFARLLAFRTAVQCVYVYVSGGIFGGAPVSSSVLVSFFLQQAFSVHIVSFNI